MLKTIQHKFFSEMNKTCCGEFVLVGVLAGVVTFYIKVFYQLLKLKQETSGGGDLLCLFLKIRKKCPDCVHRWF